jgi:hypothetical protein
LDLFTVIIRLPRTSTLMIRHLPTQVGGQADAIYIQQLARTHP